MVDGLTQKQELFAQKWIENGGNGGDAYRQVYNTESCNENTIYVEACRLLQNPKVSLRIAELQLIHQKRHEVTVDSITKEYEEVREKSIAAEQFSPAVSAITGKAKLHGLVTDKAQIGGDAQNPIRTIIEISFIE